MCAEDVTTDTQSYQVNLLDNPILGIPFQYTQVVLHELLTYMCASSPTRDRLDLQYITTDRSGSTRPCACRSLCPWAYGAHPSFIEKASASGSSHAANRLCLGHLVSGVFGMRPRHHRRIPSFWQSRSPARNGDHVRDAGACRPPAVGKWIPLG